MVTFQSLRIAFIIVCDGKFWLASVDSLKICDVKYKVVAVVLNHNRKTGASGGAALRILILDTSWHT